MPGWVTAAFIGVGGATLFLLFLVWLFKAFYRRVGPNIAMVISGGRRKTARDSQGREVIAGVRVVTGGGAWVVPVIHKIEYLSIEIMTIDVKTPEVQTSTGMPVIVDGVAQIKIKADTPSILTAAGMFLGKSVQETMSVAHQTLEGHLRAIIGRMSVEDLFREREKFAQEVQSVSATDFANMGMEVVSFVIREIKDNMGYLESLARQPSAVIRSKAAIVEAEAERDATIKSAEARRLGQAAKFAAEAEVALSERDYEMKRADYQAGVNTQKAKADLAYDQERFKTMQSVKSEEVKVAGVEKQELIKVQQLEIERKERELDATVRKPADAERYKIQTEAEAKKFQIEAEASGRASAAKALGFGEAEATRATGLAEAEVNKAKGLADANVVLAKGEAEAEAMRKKAEAWRQYNEAAVAQMFIEKLPDIARAVAEPLSRIEKIVMISNGADGVGPSKISREVIDIVSQLPPVLESVTGMNVKDLIAALPKLREHQAQAKKG